MHTREDMVLVVSYLADVLAVLTSIRKYIGAVILALVALAVIITLK